MCKIVVNGDYDDQATARKHFGHPYHKASCWSFHRRQRSRARSSYNGDRVSMRLAGAGWSPEVGLQKRMVCSVQDDLGGSLRQQWWRRPLLRLWLLVLKCLGWSQSYSRFCCCRILQFPYWDWSVQVPLSLSETGSASLNQLID